MVTFIATCFNEYNYVYGFISSLLCQTNENWKCIIYQNGKNDEIRHLIQSFNDKRIKYLETEENNGYWGCFNRIDALNNHIDTELVIQTSIQDYYIKTTVDEILNTFTIYKSDIIYFDCLHNHFNYDILYTQLQCGRIDWGCFAIKTSLAKKIGINHPKEFTADGLFIEDCKRLTPNLSSIKINKILHIHN